MRKSFLWYLASPYSYHVDDEAERKRVERLRFEQVSADAADLLKAGLNIFSPIAHTHPIELYRNTEIPREYNFWLEVDWPIFDRCDGIIIDMLPGWDQSTGVAEELSRAAEQGKVIAYYQPKVILPELLEGELQKANPQATRKYLKDTAWEDEIPQPAEEVGTGWYKMADDLISPYAELEKMVGG